MSVIETPPARPAADRDGRRGASASAVIKEALERELGRGGQVFFVHNRVAVARRSMAALHPASCARGAGRRRPRPDAASASSRRRWCGSCSGAGRRARVARPSSSRGSTSRPRTRSSSTAPTASASPSSTSSAAGSGASGCRRTPTCLSRPTGASTSRRQRRLRVLQELTELGVGLQARAPRPGDPRRRQPARAPSSTATSQRSASISTRSSWRRPCASCAASPVDGRGRSVVIRRCRRYLPGGLRPRGRPAAGALQAARGHRDGGRDRRTSGAELADRFGPLPEAAEQLLDVVTLRLDAKALRLERLEVRGGHALFTFAPSTPVPPAAHHRPPAASTDDGSGPSREFVLEATVRPGALAGDLADSSPGSSENSEGPRRHADEQGATRTRGAGGGDARWAGARKPAGPLPPVPSGSGGVPGAAPGRRRPFRTGQTLIDRVVAVVNDDVIMMSELQEAMVISRARRPEPARRRGVRAHDAQPAGRRAAAGTGSQARQGRGDRRRAARRRRRCGQAERRRPRAIRGDAEERRE